MKKIALLGVILFPLVAIAGLVSFFVSNDPATVGPTGILAVFVVIYLVTLDVTFLTVHLGLRSVGSVLARARLLHPKAWHIGAQRAYYIASIVAFGPVFLLAVSTLGQLQWRDVALVVVLLSLATIYVVKRG